MLCLDNFSTWKGCLAVSRHGPVVLTTSGQCRLCNFSTRFMLQLRSALNMAPQRVCLIAASGRNHGRNYELNDIY